MKKQDILENQAKIVYLGLGSNLGNRHINIEKAKFFLRDNGLILIKSSSYYETNSWPNNNFPKYLNIVLKVKCVLKPIKLLFLIKSIEKKLGRKNTTKNYPRTCDIDIIDYHGKSLFIKFNNKKLQIPHPRLHNRNFVLIPLYEISKNWFHPKFNENISKLLSKISITELSTIKLI